VESQTLDPRPKRRLNGEMKVILLSLLVALLMVGCGGSTYQNPINYFGHNKLYEMQERVNNQLATHPDILPPRVDLDLTVDINYS
jgi:hypothetical protein